MPRTRAAETAAAPLRLGPSALLIGSALLLSGALFLRPELDPDYWMHLRVGRWIVEHGRLPSHDLFTHTVPDHRWINHEYLSEVLFWLIHAHLGPAGVSVAVGVLTWLGMVLVLAAARPHAQRQPYVIVGLAVALAAMAGGPIWGPRPQMITFFLLSVELLWIRRSVEGTSRAILWLPLVMALWSNLHGGWPVGFLFLGVAMASETLHWLADRSRPEHLAQVRRLALVGAASAAAVLLNPNGPAILAYPFQTLGSGAQQTMIAEWRSPDFHQAALLPFEAMLLLTVAGLALGRPRLFDVLVALAGVALALESTRHIPLFVAAVTPVLISTWTDVWRRLPESVLRRLPPASPRPPLWMPAATALVLVLIAGIVATRTAHDLARQPVLVRSQVPVAAADWLAVHPHVGTRMFNQYSWGGYLADRFYPDPNRRVFIFTEGVLMGDPLLYRYGRIVTLQPGWKDELDRAGVDYVVYDRGSPLDSALAALPDWRLVHRDPTAVIYVRAGARGG